MKLRSFVWIAGALALTACGTGEVVVTAQVEVQNPDGEGMISRPLDVLEVRLIPYDRDEVFDSMTSAAPSPEPEIPPRLLTAQQEVAEAQQAWRDADAEWNELRSDLQELSDRLNALSRGSAEYRVLFADFSAMEGRLSTVERQKDQAFDRFTALQSDIAEELDAVRVLRENWADEAFAEVLTVFTERERELGLETVFDTTDATGTVRIQAPPGAWWVHARYSLPFEELYWNVPVTLNRGEPVQMVLEESNAQRRPIF